MTKTAAAAAALTTIVAASVSATKGPDRNSYVARIFYTKRLRTSQLIAKDATMSHDVACQLILALMIDVRSYAEMNDVREVAFTYAMNEAVKMTDEVRNALLGVATEGRVGRIPVVA